MQILNNLIKIDKKGNLLYNEWCEWSHFLVPNKPDWFRQILRNIIAILGHCLLCSAVDGCYFIKNNSPKHPLHIKCDCTQKVISIIKVKNNATAECDIKKFTEYIFKDKEKSNGKNEIFYSLGFNINDSLFLKQEYCKQALQQYLSSNYILKNLDIRGQRLAIPINLNGINIYSGWMLYPEGKIKNTTPFGGWVNE